MNPEARHSVNLRIDGNGNAGINMIVRRLRRSNLLRILVADDHPAVRRFVCEVLTTEGWQICGQASNGREAVEIAVQEQPDVVVLDLSMPELNGLDAARRILKAMPQAIVLMLTMYESEELTQAVLESGVAACLLKSDLQHLVKKVRSLQGSAPS